jgi:hypothetical protein
MDLTGLGGIGPSLSSRPGDCCCSRIRFVGGVGQEVERHQRVDGGAGAALGPVPVEVAERLEVTDIGGLQPALQSPAGTLRSSHSRVPMTEFDTLRRRAEALHLHGVSHWSKVATKPESRRCRSFSWS